MSGLIWIQAVCKLWPMVKSLKFLKKRKKKYPKDEIYTSYFGSGKVLTLKKLKLHPRLMKPADIAASQQSLANLSTFTLYKFDSVKSLAYINAISQKKLFVALLGINQFCWVGFMSGTPKGLQSSFMELIFKFQKNFLWLS